MAWKRFSIVAGIVALALAALLTIWSASHRTSRAERLTLAEPSQIMSSLIFIAIDEQYLAHEGLDILIQPYASGKAALAAVIEGKADVATVAEVPFIRAVLEQQPVKIFATIQTTDKDIAITGRTDVGITTPRDLAGKRIGTILGTSAEYFLQLFLTRHGLRKSGVVIVPFEPEEIVAALVGGGIEAMSAWTTMRLSAQAQLPEGTISFFGDGVYTEAWTLAAREEFLQRRPEATRKLLRALLAAERFAAANRVQAVEITAHRLHIPPKTIAALWDNFGFTVRLDQALVVNLEGQARAATQSMPLAQPLNVLSHIHLRELALVAPYRVTILR